VPQSPGESLAESLCSRLKGRQSEVIQEASVILFATFASRPVRVRVPSASSSAAPDVQLPRSDRRDGTLPGRRPRDAADPLGRRGSVLDGLPSGSPPRIRWRRLRWETRPLFRRPRCPMIWPPCRPISGLYREIFIHDLRSHRRAVGSVAQRAAHREDSALR
jgi:hypothetical protein